MNEIGSIASSGSKFSKRLFRDRFVFPEILVGTFKDNDVIIEAIENEIKNKIKEKTLDSFNSEVILKNVMGSFFDDLSFDERNSLLNIIDEMKVEKIEIIDEESINSNSVKNKHLSDDDFQEALAGAVGFLEKEKKEVIDNGNIINKKTEEKIDLVEDIKPLAGKILEIRDDKDLDK